MFCKIFLFLCVYAEYAGGNALKYNNLFLFLFLFYFIFIFVFVFYPRRVILKEPHLGTSVYEGPHNPYGRKNNTPLGVRAHFYIICAEFLRFAVQQVVPNPKKLSQGGHGFWTKKRLSTCQRYLGPYFYCR